MTDVVLVVLFTFAIAIGYLLGRRKSGKLMQRLQTWSPGKVYFQGLNFLLNEQPDKAVEEFVRLLDVNTHTLETHLALGKLMRKQGQVDRAIRIHQNLLARPQLDEAGQHQVHLELARDFMAAGLYDRAETLLQEVISESAELRSIAQRYLLDIYQNESEWHEAIKVARALLQSRYMKSNIDARKEVSRMIAHFYCQLAEEARVAKDTSAASRFLDQAAAADKTVVRVALLNATLENAEGRYKQSIKTVVKVEAQNPEWFAACLPVLLDSYNALHGEKGFDLFVQHVKNHLDNNKSTLVVNFLVEQLLQRSGQELQRSGQELQRSGKELQLSGKELQRSGKELQRLDKELQSSSQTTQPLNDLVDHSLADKPEQIERQSGDAVLAPRVLQAEEILSQHIAQHASLTASNKLVELRLAHGELSAGIEKDVRNLHQQVSDVLDRRHFYRCRNCGFSGRQLHWRCPSCKQWESIRRLEDNAPA